MAQYVYRAVSALTGQRLAEFPLTQGQFTRQRSSAGPWSAVLKLNPAIMALDPITNTTPYSIEIVVERIGADGKPRIVYGGILTDRDYNSRSQELKISGRESWAYLDKRFVEWDVTYTTIDEGLIARDLLVRAAGSPVGDFRVDLPTIGAMTTGTTQSISYLQVDCKPIAEAIEELAALQGGFEFSLEPYWNGNTLRHTFNFGFPKLGVRGGGLAKWALPGTIDSYQWRDQGGAMANEVFGIGDDGSGHALLQRVKQLPGAQPLLQGIATFRAISVKATILSLTQQRVARSARPIAQAFVRVVGNQPPELGTYALGDDVSFQFNDLRFGNVPQTFRLLGWTITPPGPRQQEFIDLMVEAA